LDNCIFCKIATRRIPARIVHEDDEVIAFHDINPAAPMHLLIVPKKHIASLADCTAGDAALLAKMTLLAPMLASEQGCGLRVDADGAPAGGFKTQFHVGPDGGQEVYHLHMHVLGGPRPWRGQR